MVGDNLLSGLNVDTEFLNKHIFEIVDRVNRHLFKDGGAVAAEPKELLLSNNGKVVSIDGVKYKIKSNRHEVIYPYKHTKIDVWLEPLNKKGKEYLHIKGKLGDEWVMNYDTLSDDHQIEVLKQMGYKFKSGGTVNGHSAATLIPYKYNGGIMSAGDGLNPGETLYVDKDNQHPDPMKLMLWGWDKDGNDVSGEYARYYERAGKPIEVLYDMPKHSTASQEKSAKFTAIREFLKNGQKNTVKDIPETTGEVEVKSIPPYIARAIYEFNPKKESLYGRMTAQRSGKKYNY